MRRSFLLPALVFVLLAQGGCAWYEYGYEDIFRDTDYDRASRYHQRVDNDVRRYVDFLDHRLRLRNEQERQIGRLLAGRTYDLLDRTRPSARGRVYPFPRRHTRDQNSTVRRWWRVADRDVERYLSRSQRDVYRDLIYYQYQQDRRDYDRRGEYDQRRNRQRR